MPLEVWIIFTALVVAAVLLLPRILPPTGPTCTRCEGTGAVNERWPDPSKPGGWHELSGSARSATVRGGCVAEALTPSRVRASARMPSVTPNH